MTISIQLVGEFFYPTDFNSHKWLAEELELERFPQKRMDFILPKLVARGYKVAVYNYAFELTKWCGSIGKKIGGTAKAVKDPCVSCSLRDLCDRDVCSKR